MNFVTYKFVILFFKSKNILHKNFFNLIFFIKKNIFQHHNLEQKNSNSNLKVSPKITRVKENVLNYQNIKKFMSKFNLRIQRVWNSYSSYKDNTLLLDQ